MIDFPHTIWIGRRTIRFAFNEENSKAYIYQGNFDIN